MPRINYLAEIRAFAAFASRSRLTANEFVLWHALLEMFNQESCGAHWPDGWLPVANARLLAQTTFGAGDSASLTTPMMASGSSGSVFAPTRRGGSTVRGVPRRDPSCSRDRLARSLGLSP